MASMQVRHARFPRVVAFVLFSLVACVLFPQAAAAAFDLRASAPQVRPVDAARLQHLGLAGLRELTPRAERSSPIIAVGQNAVGSPDSDDALWWDGFGLPVLSSVVHAVTVFDGSLIAGGEFVFAGRQRVHHIARWDGTSWAPLGDGLDGTVFSLAVYGGRLVAGGEFNRSGAERTGCVAQWDGARWSALGEPAAGCVHALALHESALVAGGCFATSSGVRNVGSWDGASWRAVGDGVNGHVFALATYRGEIVAGGDFSGSDTAVLSGIARFDGSEWQPLESGVRASASTAVHALAVFHDELIAGGWFEEAGGVAAKSIARWDGAHWSPMPPATPEGMYQSFLVDGDELVAAGFLHEPNGSSISIARWDGEAWRTPAEPMWGVRAIAMHQGSLVAGGYFQEAWPLLEPSRPVPWLGRLDGARWMGFESWASGWNGVFVSGGAEEFLEYKGRLVVAGSFQYVGSAGGWQPFHGLAVWDGAAWSRMADLNGSVHALTEYQGDLIAGGNFRIISASASGAARWDGANWSPMGSVSPLRALAVYRGELYGAGWFWDGSEGVEGVAKWEGSRWRIVGGGFPFVPFGTWISTLAVHDDKLIAAGRFDRAGSIEAKNIAAWDGKEWSALASGREHEVHELAVHGGELYAGGAGSALGSPSALARWDGSQWHEIDVRGCSYVTALHAADGRLFVGGVFTQVEGVEARNVAVWDGAAWSALGSGLDNRPNSFASYQGSLYAGGWFVEAGNKPSFGIARWDGYERVANSPTGPALKGSPNPFRSEVGISFTIAAPGPVRVDIFDVRGRRVETLLEQHEAAGPGFVTWRAAAAGRVSPGLYLARVRASGRESIAKIVFAP